METKSLLTALEKHFSLQRTTSKIVVVGLGATGFSVARFLHRLAFSFAVVDSRDKPALVEQLSQEMPDVPVFSGGFDKAALEVATHLVVSPGVSLSETAIQRALLSGVRIIGDIDLFACIVNRPVLAVTGSNGKSTVTSMLGAMGNNAGINTAIGGNLGIPSLDLLEQDAELYVLELSSFQLERTHLLNAAAATVLNVTADHLDRHADISTYAAEKQKIFSGTGVMVLNADDPVVMAMQQQGRECRTFSVKQRADYWFDETSGNLLRGEQILMNQVQLPLEGRHNVANALAALAMGDAVGMDDGKMCTALQRFTGLEHRVQKVAEINGVKYINDSKATNIGACVAALQGYQSGSVILLAGGDAKGADMHELAPVAIDKCKAVVLMGKDAELIAQVLNDEVPVYFASSMKEGVKVAAKLAENGDSVLLSPACASLDQYKNYKERGDKFTSAVRGLAK
jgi:UDP-N-acetylmuramoylalanine--D-glutamate ligase